MQQETYFYYPNSIQPFTIYVLRNGETPCSLAMRHTVPANLQVINLHYAEGAMVDYTDPLFKNLKGQPLAVSEWFYTDVLKAGLLPELDPLVLMDYRVVSYPSRMPGKQGAVCICDPDLPQ